MSTVYEQYRKQIYSLAFEDADRIYSSIVNNLDFSDQDDKDIFEMVVDAAKAYVSIRAEWDFLNREEKTNADSGRTSSHDSFITAINALARYLKKKGYDTSWHEELGDLGKDPSYRKRIGDFACYMVLLSGLAAR